MPYYRDITVDDALARLQCALVDKVQDNKVLDNKVLVQQKAVCETVTTVMCNNV